VSAERGFSHPTRERCDLCWFVFAAWVAALVLALLATRGGL
jgi:hypothetical protein